MSSTHTAPYVEYSLTFLGTGTSIGIPVPGCSCRVCRSRDRRNHRYRTSVLLQAAGQSILVDTAPEFRLQALSAGIEDLDAVFWTHSHADHLHGLDDLRALTWEAPLPGYADERTVTEIHKRFDYLWNTKHKGGGKARLDLHVVRPGQPVAIGRLHMTPIPVLHGKLPIFGWRCGPVAFITDVNMIPAESHCLLEDLELLVMSALNFNDGNPTHFSVAQAVAEIERIRPRRSYLTHFSHDVLHSEVERATPRGINAAYDGLCLKVRGPA